MMGIKPEFIKFQKSKSSDPKMISCVSLNSARVLCLMYFTLGLFIGWVLL